MSEHRYKDEELSCPPSLYRVNVSNSCQRLWCSKEFQCCCCYRWLPWRCVRSLRVAPNCKNTFFIFIQCEIDTQTRTENVSKSELADCRRLQICQRILLREKKKSLQDIQNKWKQARLYCENQNAVLVCLYQWNCDLDKSGNRKLVIVQSIGQNLKSVAHGEFQILHFPTRSRVVIQRSSQRSARHLFSGSVHEWLQLPLLLWDTTRCKERQILWKLK